MHVFDCRLPTSRAHDAFHRGAAYARSRVRDTAEIGRVFLRWRQVQLWRTLAAFPIDPAQREKFHFNLQASPVAYLWFEVQALWRAVFFHFLSAQQLEKAFQVASTLGAADLFRVLHAQGCLLDEVALAELCLKQTSFSARDPFLASPTIASEREPTSEHAERSVLKGDWREGHQLLLQSPCTANQAADIRTLIGIASSESQIDFTSLL
eukprot:m.310444 g.310444  ORF g.310444 m.310444 type:complete len:209 (+) comp55354_c0_seq8:1356-1982(+)